MLTTTNYALRYPERSDAPDLPTQLHNLDDDINSALDGLFPDSGVVTGNGTTTGLILTPATGWSVTKTQYRTIGKKQWLRMEFTRTGAAITASAAGNIGDSQVATIVDAGHRPLMDWFGVFRASLTSGSAQVTTAGVVTLVDAHSGASISTGDNVYVYMPCTIPGAAGTFAATVRDLYFPTSSDRPIGDDDVTQIALAAEKIDAALTALVPDTGTRTDAPVTPAAGYSLLIAEYRLIGKDMTLHVWLQRDGAPITANATGNVAGDPALFTIDPAFAPSLDFTVGQFRASFTGGSQSITSAGVCSMYDMHSSSTIATNTDDSSSTVQVYANYPIP